MLEITKMLQELSEKIGNNASVGVEFQRYNNHPPEIIFRVDWPDDFHFQYSFSLLRIACVPDDILKIMIYHAHQAYARKETS